MLLVLILMYFIPILVLEADGIL